MSLCDVVTCVVASQVLKLIYVCHCQWGRMCALWNQQHLLRAHPTPLSHRTHLFNIQFFSLPLAVFLFLHTLHYYYFVAAQNRNGNGKIAGRISTNVRLCVCICGWFNRHRTKLCDATGKSVLRTGATVARWHSIVQTYKCRK